MGFEAPGSPSLNARPIHTPRRRLSATGSDIIDRSRHSIDGMQGILDEFDELWERNTHLHSRSQSDVLPTTDAASNEIHRRVFSAPSPYAYKHDPSSECFETAMEDVASMSDAADPNTIVLASTEPSEDAVPQRTSIAWSIDAEEGEVPRRVPRVREARLSMQSHQASIHGGSTDLEDRASNKSPSRMPREPPPAIPIPPITPLSTKTRRGVTLQEPSPVRSQTGAGPRRKPSGPREPGPLFSPATASAPDPNLNDDNKGAMNLTNEVPSPQPPRRSSKRGPRRRNFRQSSIENLLATKPDYTIDEIKLPPAERQLMDRFVDTLSKITVEIDLDAGKRPEARRRMQNALRALEGWF